MVAVKRQLLPTQWNVVETCGCAPWWGHSCGTLLRAEDLGALEEAEALGIRVAENLIAQGAESSSPKWVRE